MSESSKNIEEPIEKPITFRMNRPIRTISAEAFGAYDYGPNGELIPYVHYRGRNINQTNNNEVSCKQEIGKLSFGSTINKRTYLNDNDGKVLPNDEK